ncbi:MAG: DNA polymerase III subunit gamma/tau [Treponema sp.]|nr:DNA polymerase III subunit gamma/tau [Candidatus Treponema merdequi]
MAYEVTATRRRPQSFDALIGQEFVAATLKHSIENGQIAHAYLFTGPRGCGKTSTARILAKALNCQHGPTATPCGECSTCQEITKGSSLDVIEIDGASNTSVNDIRQIKDEVMFPPNSCRYKIYIIDEVHMLTTNAFNALLKTIEEPPPYVIFIFATTELHEVPATIKSRCQQFNFRLVPIEKVKEQLAAACSEIGITAEDEALYWIARESTGSMRDAYTLFDQVAAFSEGHITYEKIRDKLGLVGTERLNEIFDACVDASPVAVTDKLDAFLQSGISIDQLITNSADYLRSCLLIKNGVTKEALLGQSIERYSKKVLTEWSSIQIERALSLFLNLYRDIRFSLSPRYEIELLFSKLCWLKEYVSPAEVKKAVDAAHALLMNGTSQINSSEKNSANGISSGTNSTQSSYSAASSSNSSSQFINPNLPKMATFEALESSGQNYSSQPSEPEPQEDPFDNGGALPPKTIAAATNETEFKADFSNTQSAQNNTDELEALKAKVVATMSVNDAFVSAGLMQTGKWILNENNISTTIESSFQKSQLDAKIKEISSCISAIMGREIKFSINLFEQKTNTTPVEIPEQVNILCKVFKGSVIGG